MTTGPVRCGPSISGLDTLRLEPWELKAARHAVAAGGRRRRSAIARYSGGGAAPEGRGRDRAAAGRGAPEPPPETLRAARATLGRVPALDAALSSVIDESEAVSSSEEIRAWTRTRFRLLRATADLWLMQDSPRSDRREIPRLSADSLVRGRPLPRPPADLSSDSYTPVR